MLKTIYNIIRALFTAPEVIHWIKKYEAVKEENKKLREELERLRN